MGYGSKVEGEGGMILTECLADIAPTHMEVDKPMFGVDVCRAKSSCNGPFSTNSYIGEPECNS